MSECGKVRANAAPGAAREDRILGESQGKGEWEVLCLYAFEHFVKRHCSLSLRSKGQAPLSCTSKDTGHALNDSCYPSSELEIEVRKVRFKSCLEKFSLLVVFLLFLH